MKLSSRTTLSTRSVELRKLGSSSLIHACASVGSFGSVVVSEIWFFACVIGLKASFSLLNRITIAAAINHEYNIRSSILSLAASIASAHSGRYPTGMSRRMNLAEYTLIDCATGLSSGQFELLDQARQRAEVGTIAKWEIINSVGKLVA